MPKCGYIRRRPGLQSRPQKSLKDMATQWNSKLLKLKSRGTEYDIDRKGGGLLSSLISIDHKTLSILMEFLQPFKKESDYLEQSSQLTLHLLIQKTEKGISRLLPLMDTKSTQILSLAIAHGKV